MGGNTGMTVRDERESADPELLDGAPAGSAGTASRRALLAGGGAACVALLLGACTSGGETPPPTPPEETGEPDADPPADGPEPTGDADDADEGDNSGGEVLAKVSDLPSAGGKVVGEVLLVNLGANKIKAYDAHCTHQGFLVNPPENGAIVCPNHGSMFDPATGEVGRGPATRGLRAIKIKVEGDNIIRV
jgi:Rieske Fe-S protein